MNNISIDTEATITNLEGETVTAQSVVCENKAIIILGLEAIKAAVKNPLVKGIVSMIVNLVEHLIENYCAK